MDLKSFNVCLVSEGQKQNLDSRWATKDQVQKVQMNRESKNKLQKYNNLEKI